MQTYTKEDLLSICKDILSCEDNIEKDEWWTTNRDISSIGMIELLNKVGALDINKPYDENLEEIK